MSDEKVQSCGGVRFWIPAAVVLLAAALACGAFFLSRFYLRIQRTSEKTVKVKGVGERMVRSDLGTFTITVSHNDPDFKTGFTHLRQDCSKVDAMLRALGFQPDEIVERSFNWNSVEKTVKVVNGSRTESRTEFSHYHFAMKYCIRSKRVDCIAQNYLRINDLITTGISVEVKAPEYYLSDPEIYKLELVDKATRSARSRAETIAKNAGGHLGELLSGRQGVIQINRPASGETSDYGVYDTSSVDKVMRLVVTLDFALK